MDALSSVFTVEKIKTLYLKAFIFLRIDSVHCVITEVTNIEADTFNENNLMCNTVSNRTPAM